MFSTVVLPLDDAPEGQRAVPPGAAVADRCSSTVQVVSAIPELLGPHAPATAERLGRLLDERDLAGTVDVLADDDVAAVITRWVAGQPQPLVAMATTSGGRARDVLLGSTAERLVHQLAAPILLVGPEVQADRPIADRPVLIAVGDETPKPESVELVRAWAGQMSTTPWVVTVVEPSTADDDRSGASGAVNRYASTFGDEFQWDVLHGDNAAAAIADYAERLDAGSIIATTHGRVGFERLLSGSTSFALAHQAPCPVLVHQPFTVLVHEVRGQVPSTGGS
jgi:nucleotide-binding universal stress UspA family protein